MDGHAFPGAAAFHGGKARPPPVQRMRSADLLALIFPEQSRFLDGGTLPGTPVPEHPLVFETLRDCFHEAMDLEGLRQMLRKLESGEIEFSGRDTPMPSVFAHQILNAMPYAFLDDAPLEERRARAVILRRALPENADDLGALSPEAIRGASGRCVARGEGCGGIARRADRVGPVSGE